jgi:hypothetical protein
VGQLFFDQLEAIKVTPPYQKHHAPLSIPINKRCESCVVSIWSIPESHWWAQFNIFILANPLSANQSLKHDFKSYSIIIKIRNYLGVSASN